MEINYREMGRRIAKRRKMLNLTQEEISEATALAITTFQISKQPFHTKHRNPYESM